MKEIKEIFADNEIDYSRVSEEDVATLLEIVRDFTFESLDAVPDQAIIYCLAGYVALKTASSCSFCKNLVSDGKFPEKTPGKNSR